MTDAGNTNAYAICSTLCMTWIFLLYSRHLQYFKHSVVNWFDSTLSS